MKEVIKEKRLNHIIDSAEQVFFEKGYSKANISDICKVANCSRTTLYSHFESKENIYLAVANKAFKHFFEHFSSLELPEKNGLDRVLKLAQGYIEFSKNAPKHYQMVLDFHNILKNTSNQVLESEAYALLKASSFFEEVELQASVPMHFMAKEIDRGQKDGSINSNSSAYTLFFNMWAYLMGMTNLSNFSNAQDEIQIMGVQLQDWEKNTLAVIRGMLE